MMGEGSVPYGKKLCKKLQSKRGKKTAENRGKRIKSSLMKQAQVFANEVKGIEKELIALPPKLTDHWLWMADVKRVGYMMDEILDLLQKTDADNNSP